MGSPLHGPQLYQYCLGMRKGRDNSQLFQVDKEGLIVPVMLKHDGKYSSNSRVAKSLAAVDEDKPRCSSHRCKNEEKELLTFKRPQVGRDLQ